MALQSAPLNSKHTDNQKPCGIDYSRLRALCIIPGLRDSNHAQSTKEAHEVFMNSCADVVLRPDKVLPRIHNVPAIKNSVCSRASTKDRTSDNHASQTLEAGQTQRKTRMQGKLTHDSLINLVIKALRKFPVDRSQQERQAAHSMLKTFPSLAKQLSAEELHYITNIAVIEAWDRGHIVFATSGLYVILRGAVRPYNPDSLEEDRDPRGPVLGVGDSFGWLEPPGVAGAGIVQCALTTEPSEILKVSHSGYAKLKKEKQSEASALKEGLIQSCVFYSRWPALSIQTLASLLSISYFPTNHMLVKEGKVSPFVGFIREGQCKILQSTRALIKTSQGDQWVKSQKSKGSRMRFVVVGKLEPVDSFGEVSVLQDQPSPCSIVTVTEAQIGIIQPDAVKGLDPVTIMLILQSTKATYGKMTPEEVSRQYMRQERAKEWEHIKRKVLRDTLFYNGIVEGSGKWTFCRGRTKPAPHTHTQHTRHTRNTHARVQAHPAAFDSGGSQML